MVSVKGATAGQSVGFTYDGCAVANLRYGAHPVADDLHEKVRRCTASRARAWRSRPSRRDACQVYRASATRAKSSHLRLRRFNQQRLTANRTNLMPKWGPDPRTLAYTSADGISGDLHHAARRPSSARPAAVPDIHNMLPAVSPDGTKVAPRRRAAPPTDIDIWVVDLVGKNFQT
jgi:Tol biopolymer transport system component